MQIQEFTPGRFLNIAWQLPRNDPLKDFFGFGICKTLYHALIIAGSDNIVKRYIAKLPAERSDIFISH